MPLLDVSSLSVTYPGAVKPVVKDFDLKVREGEFVGLMGSSGSGKTTIIRSIFGNLPAGTSVEGTILFSGTPMGAHRWWRDISLVPQSSMSSLNPSFRIGTTIEETCKANNVDFSHDVSASFSTSSSLPQTLRHSFLTNFQEECGNASASHSPWPATPGWSCLMKQRQVSTCWWKHISWLSWTG